MLSLVADGLADAVTWPLRQLAGAPGFFRQRLGAPGELVGFGRGLTGSARRLAAPAASSLNGSIGPHRRWAWTTASLSEVKEIRSSIGGTVNDVLLAAITRGFRDLLQARGELADGLVVRSLVPVSVRGQDEHGLITNRVSAVLANLPVGEPDPVRRLALLRGQMDDLKSTCQAVGAQLLTEMLGFAAPTLLALGSRAAFSIPQPLVQTVTTNVPGPRFPLYILGRRMEGAYPYVPIGDNMRISMAIFSYLDRFPFGITADYDAVPDLEILAEGIGRGVAELADRAAGPGRPPRARTRARARATPGAGARARARRRARARARGSRLMNTRPGDHRRLDADQHREQRPARSADVTVAVTGPTGAVGRSVIRALERDSRVGRIIGMARRPFEPAFLGWRKIRYRCGDVRDRSAVDDLVADTDVVIHLAYAILGSRGESARVNLAGSRNVFAAATAARQPAGWSSCPRSPPTATTPAIRCH